MSVHRIYGLILRYLFTFRHSWDRVSDAFYWPLLDIFLWGLTSQFIKSFSPGASIYVLMILSALLFWIIVWRTQNEISVNLMVELWDKNMINIFGSPLKFSEWITSFITIGILKTILSLSFASAVAYMLYKVHIFKVGFYLIPFAILLVMSGWVISFTISSFVLRYGSRIQTLTWTTIWAVSPFSAVYYPINILPQWAQTVSYFFPTSYVFEGMREVLATGYLDWNKVYISFALNSIYLAISLILLKRSFDNSFERGLSRIF